METAVVGCQWGDEGKGRVIDLLNNSDDYDYVVRYNGGNNAGHTVMAENWVLKLHLIPSGILNYDSTNVIAAGVAVDPKSLSSEIDDLAENGIMDFKLAISDKAHLIMPWHKIRDGITGGKIGTTKRGIGPCFGDRIARTGIRLEDLVDPSGKIRKGHFAKRVKESLEYEIPFIHFLAQQSGNDNFDYGSLDEGLNIDKIVSDFAGDFGWHKYFARFVTDTESLLHTAQKTGKGILYEGAQGALLDNDFGTYPFVTSSHPTVAGIGIGTGVAPNLDRVIGVVKAYTTRVGEGPLPTELFDEVGEYLQVNGGEKGTTTGRDRRCGWFDAMPIKLANRMNGLTELVITKLDVLSGIPGGELKISEDYNNGVPKYSTHKGWNGDITGAKEFDELPNQAQNYVNQISTLVGVKTSMISVGPEREQIIMK